MDIFNQPESYWWASIFWGALGMAYFVYGKRNKALPALLGGLGMMSAGMFVSSWWMMSLVCLGLMGGVYLLNRYGDDPL